MTAILSLAPDLMIRSKIDVAARHYGVGVRHVASEAEFRAALAEGDLPLLVLVDLDLPGVETVELVREAQEAGVARLVGFCSHVMTDLIRAARGAGAHSVMPNSTFVAAIPGLVAEVAQKVGAAPGSTA